MTHRSSAAALLLLLASDPTATANLQVRTSATPVVVHDLVVLGGRVTNPASGLDAVGNVGISGGTIRAVTARALQGRDANAGVVVFDPAQIIDRATYRNPTLPPGGLRDVMVNGGVVVRNGALQAGVLPGLAVRAPMP